MQIAVYTGDSKDFHLTTVQRGSIEVNGMAKPAQLNTRQCQVVFVTQGLEIGSSDCQLV